MLIPPKSRALTLSTPRRWRCGNTKVHTFVWSEPACCWAPMLNEGKPQLQPALHCPSEQQCDDELQTVTRHCTEHAGFLKWMNGAARKEATRMQSERELTLNATTRPKADHDELVKCESEPAA